LRTLSLGARAFIPVALAGAVILTLAPASPASAATPTSTEARQIIRIAHQQIGDRYRYGARGPSAFDCSGLVIFAYTRAGDARAVGYGHYRSARALYRWFQRRGLASRTKPRLGDIVVWGRGTHVGIYIGHGKAISALTNGVRVHGIHAVRARFTAYLHTNMWRTPLRGASRTTAAHRVVHHATAIRYTRGAVNLRRGAGVRYARIRTLPNHARLAVLGSAHDRAGRSWLMVRVAGRPGCILRTLTR
jgi:hypothetical protein